MRYLNDICDKVPYTLQFATELNPQELFKLYNVKLEEDYDSLIEKLTEYLKVLVLLRSIKLVVFVNLKDYLNEEQVKELYKITFYYKINLLLIESSQKKRIEGECYHILDEQDCLIEF